MLADLVGGVHVEAISGTQLLDQITTKLGLLSLFSSSDFKLSQPITSATDHQVVELHALPSATERIESLTHRGSLGDRMTRMASGHPDECSTRYSTTSAEPHCSFAIGAV